MHIFMKIVLIMLSTHVFITELMMSMQHEPLIGHASLKRELKEAIKHKDYATLTSLLLEHRDILSPHYEIEQNITLATFATMQGDVHAGTIILQIVGQHTEPNDHECNICLNPLDDPTLLPTSSLYQCYHNNAHTMCLLWDINQATVCPECRANFKPEHAATIAVIHRLVMAINELNIETLDDMLNELGPQSIPFDGNTFASAALQYAIMKENQVGVDIIIAFMDQMHHRNTMQARPISYSRHPTGLDSPRNPVHRTPHAVQEKTPGCFRCIRWLQCRFPWE